MTKNIIYKFRLFVYNVVKLIRVKHYIKNLLIFVPLIFSLNLTNIDKLLKSFMAFLSFSAAASFVYVINDIVDKEKDMQHPKKKLRPIASGIIPVPTAVIISGVLLAISVISGYLLSPIVMSINIVYIAINLCYSFRLKNVPIIDVSVIAFGFILRVLCGAVAISVQMSNWLLLTIMSLSFYLGFGKRRNEIIKTESSANTRLVLKFYNINFLDKAMNSMMTLAIAFYSLWTIDPNIIKTFGSSRFIWTVPLVVIGMFRYMLIVESNSDGDPTDVILSDRLLKFIIIIYVLLVLAFIYY